MAECTSICFLGKSHPWGGSLYVHHMLRLYENDKITLFIEVPSGLQTPGRMLGKWHSTLSVLDDLLLMGAVYALEDPAVIAACREAGCPKDSLKEPWYLFDAQDSLPKLYELSRAAYAKADAKLVVTSLKGSVMEGQMERAKGYPVDLELCPSAFERSRSTW